MAACRIAAGVCAVALFVSGVRTAHAQGSAPQQVNKPSSPCFRAAEGSAVPEPADLRSKNAVLRVNLTFRDFRDPNGTIRYCYVTESGDVAPNLRLHPE
jgi:hypothetical protein